MKTKTMKRVYALLVTMIGLTLFSSLVLPASAIEPGETVGFAVSVDPDYYNHVAAAASLYYYGTHSQYVRVDVSWAKASIGGAVMQFQIGEEFTIIETNHPSPEHHIHLNWHPWWTFGDPVPGEGSRISDESISPGYMASYYFIAERVDYSSSVTWVELMVSVRTYYTWEMDIDFQILDLPPYNSPPEIPSAPEGPSSGYRWDSLTYTTSTIDPDGDRVMFQFDWGDGSSQWTNWRDSGEPTSRSHSWNNIGAYLVRVRAKDELGLISGWSPYKKVNIINEPRQPCPTLFVWNGLEYVEKGVLDIHSDSDVTFLQGIEPILVQEDHLYKLSLRELDEFTSHIDYVKLYAVDNDAEKHESNLVQAVHNELGHVNSLLLRDDDKRVDLTPMQTIDLEFTAPNTNEIAYFIFEINGYNIKP